MGNNFVSILLYSIFVLCVLGSLGIILWLYRLNSQKQVKSRLYEFVDRQREEGERSPQFLSPETLQLSRIEGIRARINRALSRLSTSELRLKVASSYWPISEIEFIFIRMVISLVGLFLGWIISHNILGGLGLGLLLYLIPGLILERAIIRRRKRFQNQLVDVLVLVKGSILVGSSLQQALNLVVKEIPAPASEEFNQVLRETKIGISFVQALQNLELRMQSDDLKIVVTAIILNNQLGGNLSTLLESTIETIRERLRLFGEVRSLTSYSRLVGGIITLLPLIMAVVIYLENPKYFDPVKTSIVAQIVLVMAGVGIILGNIVMRLVMRIRI